MSDELDIPMTFDGPSYRVPRRHSGMDPNTKRLAIIAGGIGGTFALLIGAWTLTGTHRGGIPVIEAAAGPIRVKPDKPGGLEVFGGDDSLLTGNADEKEAVAPAPESPDPAGLRAQGERETAAADTAAKSAAAAAAASAAAASQPAQSAATTLPPPTAMRTTAQATSTPATTAPAAAGPGAVAQPTQQASLSTAAPASPPSSASPTAAAEPKSAPAKSGAMQVQFAALGSEQAAMTEWSRLAKKMPDLLGDKQPAVTRTERDGKTYFRLRTGGFTDTAQATSFCLRVREKGSACSIASF